MFGIPNLSSNNNNNPQKRSFFGGMGFFDNLEFETIAQKSVQMAINTTEDVITSTADLVENDVLTSKAPEKAGGKFPSKGTIENFQTPKGPEKNPADTQYKKLFYDSLERALMNARGFAHTSALKEESRLEVRMPTDLKNQKLHLSLDYSEEHTKTAYHMAELRRKIKEDQEEDKKSQSQQEVKPTGKNSNLFKLNATEGNSIVANAIMSAG